MPLPVEIFGPTLAAYVFPFDGGDEHVLDIHGALVSIDTSKTLGDPAGTFSITLTSERDAQGRTWAKRIRPMDHVQIYLSRTAQKGTGNDIIGNDPTKAKIVMRGFVDNVFERTRIGSDGRIARVVTINGRDYGKVLLKRALVFASELDPISAIAPDSTVSGLLSNAGLGSFLAFIPPLEFISRVREILLGDPIVGAQFRNGNVPLLHAETDIPDSHVVQIVNITPTTGSIWNFMQAFHGKPFNEMFIRDDDDFPRLHWRMAPLKDKAGRIAREGAQSPPSLNVSLREVIADETGTSDNEAFCYFFTYTSIVDQSGFEGAGLDPLSLGALDQNADPFGTGGAADIFAVGASPHNPIVRRDIFERYGFQALRVDYPTPPMILTPDREADPTKQGELSAELSRMNAWLHNVYSPNPGLESGSLTLRGNPGVRIGNYLNIIEQRREFYVEGVRHNFTIWPTPSFTTVVDVTRGRWYANNPYAELNWL